MRLLSLKHLFPKLPAGLEPATHALRMLMPFIIFFLYLRGEMGNDHASEFLFLFPHNIAHFPPLRNIF